MSWMLEELRERVVLFWGRVLSRADEDGTVSGVNREKVVVFIISFILALCMWMLVNLNRDYIIDVELPVTLGNIPDDRALVKELPGHVTASVQGEGWKLINLYNTPPQLYVDVGEEEVSLFDQVLQQMNALPEIDVQKVQPQSMRIELEDKVSRRVPVRSRAAIGFRDRYNLVGLQRISPDSITVTGAASLVEALDEWPTDSVSFSGIDENFYRQVPLKTPDTPVTLSRREVTVQGEVTEFTEGESRVFIRSRNFPRGRNITYNPSSVTVRYTIPIGEYTDAKDATLFSAFVSYDQIVEDSSGYITPEIELASDRFYIRIQSYQPNRVEYFMVMDE